MLNKLKSPEYKNNSGKNNLLTYIDSNNNVKVGIAGDKNLKINIPANVTRIEFDFGMYGKTGVDIVSYS